MNDVQYNISAQDQQEQKVDYVEEHISLTTQDEERLLPQIVKYQKEYVWSTW